MSPTGDVPPVTGKENAAIIWASMFRHGKPEGRYASGAHALGRALGYQGSADSACPVR
ncbi:MAG: hypothetical protein ABFD81_14140 [Syntrophaceae bacterium]